MADKADNDGKAENAKGLAERLASLSPEKQALLLARLKAKKKKEGGGAERSLETITPAPRRGSEEDGGGGEQRFAVSFSQLREWILDRLDPGSGAYNIANALSLEGRLSHRGLSGAADALARRHESLRTYFEAGASPLEGAEGSEPAQVVAPRLRLPLPVVDLSGLADPEREARRLSRREARRPFTLTRLPLVRLVLLHLAGDRGEGGGLHWLLFTLHHIISDGWSMGVFSREIAALYQEAVTGAPSGLPELPIQYPDFAVWQRETLRGEVLARHLEYWREQLLPLPEPLDLPFDRPRPPVRTGRGAPLHVLYSAELRDRLTAMARSRGASLFMVLLGAFKALLARYTDSTDVTVGTYIANRNRAETKGLIGFFINTLALRTDLGGDPGFEELLGRVRETTLGAYAHQDLPFEKLLDTFEVPRDPSRTPLFQVLAVLQNMPLGEVALSGLTLGPVPKEGFKADFDLTLWMTEGTDGLAINFEHATDLFDTTTVARLGEHLRTVLRGALAAPAAPLSELPLLGPAERHQVALEWDGGAVAGPGGDGASGWSEAGGPLPAVPAAFAARARRTPEAVAVIPGPDSSDQAPVTYGELLAWAARIAAVLDEALSAGGVTLASEPLVALPAGRTPGHVAALLGILGAGAAYLPLDPSHPEERLAVLLGDGEAPGVAPGAASRPALLAAPGGAEALPEAVRKAAEAAGVRALDLPGRPSSEGAKAGAAESAYPTESAAAALSGPAGLERTAYVLYTSGSTGTPKGVEVTHRSMAAYTAKAAEAFRVTPDDRVLQFASLTFDTSVEEIFPALTRGAAVVLRGETLPAPADLVALAREKGVTLLDLPTAYWHALLASAAGLGLPESVSRVVLGGEAASPESVEAWRRSAPEGVELVNTYGPTEGTVVVTREVLAGPGRREGAGEGEPHPGEREKAVPIGRPLPGSRVLVLDRRLRPVGVGVPGQAALGGEGGGRSVLARGYRGRPAATAAVFVPDPTPGAAAGGRIYLTGDRVRTLADGRLQFVGRVDHQVKIRGIRVELGEIEAVLAAHPRVAEAVVVPRRREGEATITLAAYAVPAAGEAGLDGAELRRHLAERLPAAMVPAAFVVLDALPLTAQGKVDRRALPEPEGESGAAGAARYVPPTGPEERAVAEVWSRVLGLERVGRDDNFFEIGGDSLRLLAVHEALGQRTGVEVPVLDLFRYPTVAALAARLGQDDSAGREAVEAAREIGEEQRRQASARRERLRARRRGDEVGAVSSRRPNFGVYESGADSSEAGEKGRAGGRDESGADSSTPRKIGAAERRRPGRGGAGDPSPDRNRPGRRRPGRREDG